MAKFRSSAAFAALTGAVVLCGASAAVLAAGYVETDLVVNQQVNGVPTLTDANGIVHVAKFLRRMRDASNPGPCGLNRRPPCAEWQVRQSRSVWQLTQDSRPWRAA